MSDWKNWAQRTVQRDAEEPEPPPPVAEGLEHVSERLREGKVSSKVMRQLRHSNRAYKGWATRRSKGE